MPQSQNQLQSAVYLLKQITPQKDPVTKQLMQPRMDARKLTAHQRRVCVRFMVEERKFSETEMAEVLRVSRSTITRAKKKIRNQNSWMLDEVDERKVVVQILLDAEFAITKLTQEKQYYEAWQVRRQLKEELQDLGYLTKEPIKFAGQITLPELYEIARRHNLKGADDNGHELPEEDRKFLVEPGGNGGAGPGPSN